MLVGRILTFFLPIVLAGVIFGGIASAGSAPNGYYKGYPVVRLVVKGNDVAGDVPAVIMDGRTMVPVRVITEALGQKISWNSRTLTLNIGESAPKQVEVTSSSSYRDKFGVFHVVGEVRNNMNAPAESVRVIGTFYDAKGIVVATDFDYADPDTIGAGGRAAFDITVVDNAEKIKRYALGIQS